MEERPLQLFLRAAVEELQSWSGQVSAPLFGPAYCSMLGRYRTSSCSNSIVTYC